MISTETSAVLRERLEPIYDSLVSSERAPAWTMPNCVEWSQKALPIVRSILGQQVRRVSYYYDYEQRLAKGYDLPRTNHSYLADMTMPDPLIIDGTYLQFASPRISDAPHVLVSTALQSAGVLEKAGVISEAWPCWRLDLHYNKVIWPDLTETSA